MSNMIKIGGRFVIPTQEILEKLHGGAEIKEVSINQIVGEDIFVEDSVTTDVAVTTKDLETPVNVVKEAIKQQEVVNTPTKLPVKKKTRRKITKK